MKTMLLLYSDEAAWAAQTPAEMEREMGAYFAYTNTLREAGKLVMGHELAPAASAKTLTLQGGGGVCDGPFAETKERLGGYYLIEVDSLEEALDWARRCPGAAHGHVEVRPVIEHDG